MTICNHCQGSGIVGLLGLPCSHCRPVEFEEKWRHAGEEETTVGREELERLRKVEVAARRLIEAKNSRSPTSGNDYYDAQRELSEVLR